ncbi:MAG: hypothetical protein J6B60_03845 [Clostridia bacterium]|nr:hypothetical protein [Clostridia bacterium]
MSKWIWLPREKYPARQSTKYSAFIAGGETYTVAEFKKEYIFEKSVEKIDIYVSADTSFVLYLNNEAIATGPVCVGGDFMGNEAPPEKFYTSRVTIYPKTEKISFFARVRMMPEKLCEYSKGCGGFMLFGETVLENGEKIDIATDESWLVRYNGSYTRANTYDQRISPDEYVNAKTVEDIWKATVAPIPVRTEKTYTFPTITVKAGEKTDIKNELDMIYAGYACIKAKAKGEVCVNLCLKEIPCDRGSWESATFMDDGEYRGINLHSVGEIEGNIENKSSSDAEIEISVITTCYPVYKEAKTVTDDSELNKVLDVCRHTLKYCRQTHHLDSPRHCEPLACMGDYYIESLMTAFSFGDMSLAEFDIKRISDRLESTNGRLFHTTYSLIFVKMIYDIYNITNNINMLKESAHGINLIFDRFESYIGETGLIETPPDYMFIDWIYIDEISMHHPPKALGQTCLNMFYYGALESAEHIYNIIGSKARAEKCALMKEKIKNAINTHLYDKEKRCYFEGLNTETPEEMLYQYLPANVEKRYYLKHSNILAAYFGICDNELAIELIDRIMSDDIKGDYQPYFAHYLLEAINRCSLREKYTLKLIDKWKAPVRECQKGLVEGFIPPEPTYNFDHSHAWGGTPLYSLPKALLGLEIIEAGYKKIKLSPSLLGLSYARVELPTPYGDILCEMHKGKKPNITVPKEITVDVL